MKKILPLFVLISSVCFASENKPFWEQDKHFQKYRCVMIEASIHRIESLLKNCAPSEIDPFLKSMIFEEIEVIKFNL